MSKFVCPKNDDGPQNHVCTALKPVTQDRPPEATPHPQGPELLKVHDHKDREVRTEAPDLSLALFPYADSVTLGCLGLGFHDFTPERLAVSPSGLRKPQKPYVVSSGLLAAGALAEPHTKKMTMFNCGGQHHTSQERERWHGKINSSPCKAL